MTISTIAIVILLALIALYAVICMALIIGQTVEYRTSLNAFLKAWDDNDFYVRLQQPYDREHYVEIRFKDGLSERKLTTDLDGVSRGRIHWSDSEKAASLKARRCERRDLTEYTAQIVTMARLEGRLDPDETGDDGASMAMSGP
jgi:hypothetical protein